MQTASGTPVTRQGLRARIVAPILAAVAILAVGLTVVATTALEDALQDEAERTAQSLAGILAGDPEIVIDLEAGGAAVYAQERFGELLAEHTTVDAIAAYDSRGRRITQSGDVQLPYEQDNLLEGGLEGAVRVRYPVIGNPTAEADAEQIGWIALQWSLRDLAAVGATFRTRLIFLAALLLAVCAYTTNRTASRILQRLRDLLTAMARVTNGHLGQRLPVTDRDEFGAMAQRFNMMSKTLEENRDEIQRHAAALEQHVAERTAALRRANEELRTLDSAKDAFLSNISHEMRTPLTSIIAAVEIIQQFADDDPAAVSEFLNGIDCNAQRLARLINRLIDIAKLEANGLELDAKRCDFRQLVESSIMRCSERARERSVAIILRGPTHPFEVECDQNRVDQVLDNLIDNATQFSPEGCSVELTLEANDGDAVLWVRDEGPGVPQEYRHRVFEKFQQADAVLTDKPQGVGLGLAFGSRIVRAHEGSLSYVEEADWGACFRMTLPMLSEDVELTAPVDGNEILVPAPIG